MGCYRTPRRLGVKNMEEKIPRHVAIITANMLPTSRRISSEAYYGAQNAVLQRVCDDNQKAELLLWFEHAVKSIKKTMVSGRRGLRCHHTCHWLGQRSHRL